MAAKGGAWWVLCCLASWFLGPQNRMLGPGVEQRQDPALPFACTVPECWVARIPAPVPPIP